MPSPREAYRDILVKNLAVDPAKIFTSKPVNCEGRNKVTFLVVCDQQCDMTLEWSYNGKEDWYPLENAVGIVCNPDVLRRVTIDDALAYMRVKVDAYAGAGTMSAWVTAI